MERDAGAPIQHEVDRLTNAVIEALGPVDLESGLTVMTNITGQLVAHLCKGQPGMVDRHMMSVAAGIKAAALTKLLHDDKQRRELAREGKGEDDPY